MHGARYLEIIDHFSRGERETDYTSTQSHHSVPTDESPATSLFDHLLRGVLQADEIKSRRYAERVIPFIGRDCSTMIDDALRETSRRTINQRRNYWHD